MAAIVRYTINVDLSSLNKEALLRVIAEQNGAFKEKDHELKNRR